MSFQNSTVKSTNPSEQEQKTNRDISWKKDIEMDPELPFFDFTMVQSDLYPAKTLLQNLTFDLGQ